MPPFGQIGGTTTNLLTKKTTQPQPGPPAQWLQHRAPDPPFSVSSLITEDFVMYDEDIKCQMCDFQCPRQAFKSCAECEIHFCEYCLEEHHSRGPYRSHRLVSPGELALDSGRRCEAHRERYKRLCVHCGALLCALCVEGTAHHGHRTVGIKEGTRMVKESLVSVLCCLGNVTRSPGDDAAVSWEPVEGSVREVREALEYGADEFLHRVDRKMRDLHELVWGMQDELMKARDKEKKEVEDLLDKSLATVKKNNLYDLVQNYTELYEGLWSVKWRTSRTEGGSPRFSFSANQLVDSLKVKVTTSADRKKGHKKKSCDQPTQQQAVEKPVEQQNVPGKASVEPVIPSVAYKAVIDDAFPLMANYCDIGVMPEYQHLSREELRLANNLNKKGSGNIPYNSSSPEGHNTDQSSHAVQVNKGGGFFGQTVMQGGFRDVGHQNKASSDTVNTGLFGTSPPEKRTLFGSTANQPFGAINNQTKQADPTSKPQIFASNVWQEKNNTNTFGQNQTPSGSSQRNNNVFGTRGFSFGGSQTTNNSGSNSLFGGSNQANSQGFGVNQARAGLFGSSQPLVLGFGGQSQKQTSISSTQPPSQNDVGSTKPAQNIFGRNQSQQAGFASVQTQPSGFSSTSFGSTQPHSGLDHTQNAFGSSQPPQTSFGSSQEQHTGFGSSHPQQSGFSLNKNSFGSSQPAQNANSSIQPNQLSVELNQTSGFGFGTSQQQSSFGSNQQQTEVTSTQPSQSANGTTQLIVGSNQPSGFGFDSSQQQRIFGSNQQQPTVSLIQPSQNPSASTQSSVESGQQSGFSIGQQAYFGSRQQKANSSTTQPSQTLFNFSPPSQSTSGSEQQQSAFKSTSHVQNNVFGSTANQISHSEAFHQAGFGSSKPVFESNQSTPPDLKQTQPSHSGGFNTGQFETAKETLWNQTNDCSSADSNQNPTASKQENSQAPCRANKTSSIRVGLLADCNDSQDVTRIDKNEESSSGGPSSRFVAGSSQATTEASPFSKQRSEKDQILPTTVASNDSQLMVLKPSPSAKETSSNVQETSVLAASKFSFGGFGSSKPSELTTSTDEQSINDQAHADGSLFPGFESLRYRVRNVDDSDSESSSSGSSVQSRQSLSKPSPFNFAATKSEDDSKLIKDLSQDLATRLQSSSEKLSAAKSTLGGYLFGKKEPLRKDSSSSAGTELTPFSFGKKSSATKREDGFGTDQAHNKHLASAFTFENKGLKGNGTIRANFKSNTIILKFVQCVI